MTRPRLTQAVLAGLTVMANEWLAWAGNNLLPFSSHPLRGNALKAVDWLTAMTAYRAERRPKPKPSTRPLNS